MKKLGFVFIFLFCTSYAFSQSWFVGGSAIFDLNSITNTNNETRTTISLFPEIGYKLSSIDLGIRPIFEHRVYRIEDYFGTTRSNNTRVGLGLFARYNLITFFDRLSILGRIDIDYSFTWRSPYIYSLAFIHRANIGISPVLEFNITDRFSLFATVNQVVQISYIYSSFDAEYPRIQHVLVFSSSSVRSLSNIMFGFYVTF